jgi:hypothetical protein
MKNCPSYHDQTQEKAILDRRKHTRREAAGEVVLVLDRGMEVTALLRDESESGFRALHHYFLLESGQEIRYRMRGRQGRARVIWCRIDSNECESGFYVL